MAILDNFGVLDGLMAKNGTGEPFSEQESNLIRGAQDLNTAQEGTDQILAKQLEINMLRETRAHNEMSRRTQEFRQKAKHDELIEVLESPAFICGIVFGLLAIR